MIIDFRVLSRSDARGELVRRGWEELEPDPRASFSVLEWLQTENPVQK